MAARQGQEEVLGFWRQHRDTQRFLQKFWPEKWDRIRQCSMEYTFHEDLDRPGFVKRRPRRCHQVPYCIVCARHDGLIRTMKTFDHFSRTTPKGKQMRFVHIVQTAPLTTQWQGWGAEASRDVRGFGRVVWDALKDEYGEGIGAVMSYQDFGERGFAKRHPHQDLTLNGWRLTNDGPVAVPRMDLAGNGRARWDARVAKRASKEWGIAARRGNVDVLGVRVGVPAYFKILRYQMRELVDFRKITYARGARDIHWNDYATKRRTRIAVGDFLLGLKEYELRLGRWSGGVGAKNLHRLYGSMAKRSIGKTEAAIGGQPLPHKGNCPCVECGDWIDVELTPEEERQLRPRRVAWVR